MFFTKKKEVEKDGMPMLPELPKLPELGNFDDDDRHIHKLPSFPHNSYGTKFSQDTIKEAVTGEKEMSSSDAEDWDEDEDEMRMTQEPLRKPMTSEIDDEDMPSERRNFTNTRNSSEPVFVRIDLFEEALKTFNEAKKKISEIEKNLIEIKRVREKEDMELASWEKEVNAMKNQIGKVERDVFSKV